MPLGISGGAVVDPVAAPQEKAQCPGVGLPDSDLGEVVLGHGMLKQAASQPLALLGRKNSSRLWPLTPRTPTGAPVSSKATVKWATVRRTWTTPAARSCTVWRGRALWSAWTVAVQRASNRAIHAGERS